MNGILIVDKPEAVTSAEVVRQVKRRLLAKVGHLGTLDPFATGVLPLCLGEATKIAQFLSTADKTYQGVIRLGAATDSGDRTGHIIRTAPVPELETERLREVERRFTGDTAQVPPMYSALKRAGVPLYRLARRGIAVERAARQVRIAALQLEPCGPGQLRFEVTCSKGTYVRVLAEDIGEALGSTAHLEALRRTRFGRFDLGQAVDLSRWDPHDPAAVISIRRALAHLPACVLTARGAAAARHGQAWVLDEIQAPPHDEVAVLLDPEDHVAAVVRRRDGGWAFARVLDPPTLQG